MTASLRERMSSALLKRKLITSEQLEKAVKIQKQKKEKLGDILVGLGFVTKDSLLEVMSAELGIPAIRLNRYKIEPAAIALLPRKLAEHYCLIPLSVISGTLTVAMADPLNPEALDDLKAQTGMNVRALLATDRDIRDAIETYYGENVSQAIQEVIKDMSSEESLEVQQSGFSTDEYGSKQELMRLTEEEPVVKLTNSILGEGVRRRSSDIFVEPEESALRVRFRVDGVLQEGLVTSRAMHAGVVSRIKVVSNLDIAEHRIPQDGRFKLKIRDQEIDFRVSVLPSYFGEKVVLRILDKSQAILDIDRLGFEAKPLEDLKRAAAHPHGMIVICGPTGAGKTTTLYSVLKLLDNPEKNIVTVEDPVEFQIEGINQVSVRPEIELTFAAALRSILRQDPDIIMVGEIRDGETADVAIKAALTGHLVLSTLHATTAAGAVTRLLNMGVEPFLITSSVLLAGSQRLVRRLCLKCREGYEPTKEMLRQIGVTDRHIGGAKLTFFRAKGCDACNQKGYTGRAVILEALTLTPVIKALVLRGAQEYEIKRTGISEGMMTLRENGIAKMLQGITTPEEVVRVTVRDDDVSAGTDA